MYKFLFLLWSSICLNGQYYLYDDDCLDFHVAEFAHLYSVLGKEFKGEHQIVPYCRRNYLEEDKAIDADNNISSYTFDHLNKSNITSLQLYSWSIHLDLVEEYQAFREYKSPQMNNTLFYNCSSKQKFGLFCQYSLNLHVSLTKLRRNFVCSRFIYRSLSIYLLSSHWQIENF
jgi:hypothetical protein